MVPVVCIVGYSNSGKTGLVERLIGELKRRGRRVAAVKHTDKEFDIDHPGKDTWRFARAGSDAVAIFGARRSAVLKRHDDDGALEDVLRALGDGYDIVFVEGLHRGEFPKIEVRRSGSGRGARCGPEELLAVVTDDPSETRCKRFSPDETAAVADFLEERVLDRCEGGTRLAVNGRPVSLGSFTQRIIAGTVLGLVSALKGIGEIKTVSVSIRGDPGRASRS